MPRNFRDKMALSGITVLMLGVVLLIFTFISAYGFLTEGLSIIASSDLVQTFGEALAPLIATCIRIMYLGVMGWIGSGLTVRGVQLVTQLKRLARPEFQSRTPPVIKPMEPIRAQETKKN